ncbi:Na+/H+ antiporter NhaC [Persicobacter sp. CCB-QB2]|uniref:Na+/H+ antiporter NhaC n=1 Tax=Persicobacter sp. CCB-QB2 TaxID=1561025 RepID=UPI0006A97460|nr:Na+/H+ antiporter NhaC [Persicobacter sp. CCB-QB2]
MEQKSYKTPSLLQALIPVSLLILLLAANVFIFGDDATYGPNQIALILAAALAGVVGVNLHYNWDDMQEGIVQSIKSSLPAILILLLIGSLSGTWLLSGIVPSMIYYGLGIMTPKIFLFATVIICAIASIAIGSSWTTIATIGIALLGIGSALGFDKPMIAGAIISGAYFGDKISPMSDTTNLAPAMAGTDLFTHIRSMMFTTVPSIIITLIIFLILGFQHSSGADAGNIEAIRESIDQTFNITPWLFLVPVMVIGLILKKVPAIPALLIGTLLGGIFAWIFQPSVIQQVAGTEDFTWVAPYSVLMKSMFTTISITTENTQVNELLTSSGMEGMLNTIWLIICAMIFGGIMESTGLLQRITAAIISKVNSVGGLISATAGSCLFFNVTASDQYLSIVVPGRMFADVYRNRGIAPEVLSRTLEDSGTVTSVLIPWNTCGAYQAGVLSVGTLAYLPYCFFNILSPFVTIIFGYLFVKPDAAKKAEPVVAVD